MDTLQGFDIDLCTVAAGTPGLAVLQYAGLDTADAESFEPAVDAGYIHRRTVSATWRTLPFVVGTGALSEEEASDPQGPYFNIDLSVFLPGDSPEIRAELNRMRRRRFVVSTTGRDARPLLIGNPEQPLRFESRFGTGPQGDSQRGHTCRFRGISLQKISDYIPTW